jgi:hypothetical protein
MPAEDSPDVGKIFHRSLSEAVRAWREIGWPKLLWACRHQPKSFEGSQMASPSLWAFEVGFVAGTRYVGLLRDGLGKDDAGWIAVGDAVTMGIGDLPAVRGIDRDSIRPTSGAASRSARLAP